MSLCDDDGLPNMSFSQEPSSMSPRNASPKKSTAFFLSKLNKEAEMMQEYQKRTETKRQLEDMVRNEGYGFNEQAQLKEPTIDSDDDLELDDGQKAFLAKCFASGQNDPQIPLRPNLDSLFDFDQCNIRIINYPKETCTENFRNLLKKIDPSINNDLNTYLREVIKPYHFCKFISQIPNDVLRIQVLDTLVLNSLWRSQCDLLFFVETINSCLLESKGFAQTEWHLSANLLLELLKSLGMDMNKFQAYFPNKSPPNQLKIDANLIVKIDHKPLTNDHLCQKLSVAVELLICSLQQKPSKYSRDESHLLVKLFFFLILDSNLGSSLVVNLKVQIQKIFELLPDLDTSSLSQDVCHLIHIMKSDLKSNDEVNNLFHKFIHLISFFKVSTSKRLKQLIANVAMSCLVDSFETVLGLDKMETTSHQVGDLEDLDLALDLIEREMSNLFYKSSYAMFNAIKFLEVIVIEKTRSCCQDEAERSQNMEIVSRIKSLVLKTNRQVKERPEFYERTKTKIVISNFINKLEYLNGDNAANKRCLLTDNLTKAPSTPNYEVELIVNKRNMDINESQVYCSQLDCSQLASLY